jgi:hypothetical protein
MEESESRIEMAATSESAADLLVAARILDRPVEFTRWEAHHSQLMRPVSAQVHLTEQMVALRAVALRLVHRRALFAYLRERRVAEARRRKLFSVFHPCSGYTNAVLAEHANYVRCSSSHLCTQHLAEHLMHDPALDGPLALYEEWYAEYFRAFCDIELAETEMEGQAALALEALRPLLKHRVTEARGAILAMPLRPREWRDVQIRRPTGDTQQLRALVMKH